MPTIKIKALPHRTRKKHRMFKTGATVETQPGALWVDYLTFVRVYTHRVGFHPKSAYACEV
jgi:hypothetical protein